MAGGGAEVSSEVPGEQKLRSVIVSKSTVSGPAVSEEIIGKASGKFTAHSGSCGVTHLPFAYANLVRDLFCALACGERKWSPFLPLALFIVKAVVEGID